MPERPSVSPIYAKTYNRLLQYLADEKSPRELLPIQSELAGQMGVSATTIFRIVAEMRELGILSGDRGRSVLERKPRPDDFYPEPEALSRRVSVEDSLKRRLVQGAFKPGDVFSELALAREHGVTTGTVREALLNLSRLGVFSKSSRKRWEVQKLDGQRIEEMMELRELIELYALDRYFTRMTASNLKVFRKIREETQRLLSTGDALEAQRETFFDLDRRLHEGLIEASGNRYLSEHFQVVTFPIQAQFLHSDFGEDLLSLGLKQHLQFLDALFQGDLQASRAALSLHLQEARRTLLTLLA